jgi:hypothetical protein
VFCGVQLAALDGCEYAFSSEPQEAGGLLCGVVCGHLLPFCGKPVSAPRRASDMVIIAVDHDAVS